MEHHNTRLDYLLHPIAPDVINYSESSFVTFEAIQQTIRPVLPNTLFPSFDYVDSDVADILDSIATVLLLWNFSSILGRLILLPYRNTSKSLAMKSFFDNLVSVNFCLPQQLGKNLYLLIQSRRRFHNFRIKLFALISFIILVMVEVLLIFSQTLISKELGLESSGLQALTWDVPSTGFM